MKDLSKELLKNILGPLNVIINKILKKQLESVIKLEG